MVHKQTSKQKIDRIVVLSEFAIGLDHRLKNIYMWIIFYIYILF